MTRISDVSAYLDEICPASMGLATDSLGYLHGDGQDECTGVLCCWRPVSPVVEKAAREHLNLLVVHEALWVNEQKSGWYEDTPAEQKISNQRRRQALEKGKLHVFRLHSNWDAYPKDGVPDQFGALLDLGPEVGRGKFTRVYEMVQPKSLGALVEHINALEGHPAARLLGAPADRKVQKVGIMSGGFGGNQNNMPEEVQRLGGDVVIVGDLVETTALNAAEIGVATIETLHSFTEEPAIRRQADMITQRFPDLRVEYVVSGIRAWEDPAFDQHA